MFGGTSANYTHNKARTAFALIPLAVHPQPMIRRSEGTHLDIMTTLWRVFGQACRNVTARFGRCDVIATFKACFMQASCRESLHDHCCDLLRSFSLILRACIPRQPVRRHRGQRQYCQANATNNGIQAECLRWQRQRCPGATPCLLPSSCPPADSASLSTCFVLSRHQCLSQSTLSSSFPCLNAESCNDARLNLNQVSQLSAPCLCLACSRIRYVQLSPSRFQIWFLHQGKSPPTRQLLWDRGHCTAVAGASYRRQYYKCLTCTACTAPSPMYVVTM
ncbi:hypothetical protein OH76DRAFT_1517082 [Lentinus brumalis]|uniref:Uncharacterized protein n=1 Tax=Lentinus brumalis TaxID=2498619 RepID=A0A371D973_9APHY|nr:hypothetical protein OH76DRAFT_1517082 [Polyporus brumalis]